QTGFTRQRLTREVLPAERHGLLRLLVQFRLLLLQLRNLQFETLTARRDVGNTAADLLQQLQLLLVRVIQGLVRVFGVVEGLIGLRSEYRADPLKDTHWLQLAPHDFRRRPRSGLRTRYLIDD